MCTEGQHEAVLHALYAIEHAVSTTEKRQPIDVTAMISTTQPLVIDYKERRHLFIWSANALTFSLEDLGTLTVGANAWVNIGYQEGMRLVPATTANTVPVFVRATDESVP